MTRLKGFGQDDISTQVIDQGVFHKPDISKLRDAEVIAPLDLEVTPTHLEALKVGVPVVAATFEDTLRRAPQFEYYADKKIEAKRSAHHVSFGRFVGWVPELGTRDGVLKVAIKPFSSPETALHEFDMYRMLGRMTVESYEPVAVFPAVNGKSFVTLSQKRNDLQSLDRDEWVIGGRVTSAETDEIAERNRQTVKDIAEAMGFLHSMGIFHPDGQIKNWAVTQERQIGVIDTENMKITSVLNSDIHTMAWYDIEKLVKSLIVEVDDPDSDENKLFGVGMYARMPLNQVRSAIQQDIILPYCNSLLLMASNNPNPAERAAIEELAFGMVESIDGGGVEGDWPQHLIDLNKANSNKFLTGVK